jgi:polyisoprenoid-binding protein YceI
MIKMNMAAGLMLSGSLFAGRVSFAPHSANPAQLVASLGSTSPVARPQDTQGIPVFEITPVNGWIKFDVKASLDIAGKFDKWDASLTFTSPDETTGVLEIKIYADSVDTGSGMKNGKLKGKDFFDVERNPLDHV